jgi:hypothetical protein
MGESRYVSLLKKSPDRAQALFAAAAQEAYERRETLRRMAAEQDKE